MNPLGDFSRFTAIIPQDRLPGLRKNLGKVPDVSWLLSAPHSSEKRLQGDILSKMPTVILDDQGEPKVANFTVLLLNNSCDLPEGRSDFVTVAPVVDFGKYMERERTRRDEKSLAGYSSALRSNLKTELLYLPNFEGFPDGALVLLHLVSSVSSTLYRKALENGSRVASFSQYGFYFLLIKLTTHLARAESQDVSRFEA